jgi:hypothetical protein
VSPRAASLALFLLVLGAVAAKAAGAPVPMQQLPLPEIMARPTPLPMPPPTSPSAPTIPNSGISPLLLEPGPVYVFPPNSPPPAPPAPPGPIDQQKVSSYRMWLEGQQRLIQRSGGNPADLLGREIQQQLLQLDQPGGSR